VFIVFESSIIEDSKLQLLFPVKKDMKNPYTSRHKGKCLYAMLQMSINGLLHKRTTKNPYLTAGVP
jgi:hypothetical protein